ncbi:hypothetical protein RSK60_1400043 [Ralstonia solanacearum K60]|nr:hypothetical protein RSK60_1400043 [Ralstonia solanacearum K60]
MHVAQSHGEARIPVIERAGV